METKYATYKGRTYKIIYQGKKAGKVITKLGFLDGSSEFWAKEGEPVTPTNAPPKSGQFGFSRRRRGPCGYPGCDGTNFCDECSD
jgi:hypothetical protein